MRGHEQIIRMRLARKVPAIVFVNDYPCLTDWSKHGDHATVCVAGDLIKVQDFRYLKGLKVSISSNSEDRAKDLFECIKNAGASQVAACHVQAGVKPWEQSGWVGMWSEEMAHG